MVTPRGNMLGVCFHEDLRWFDVSYCIIMYFMYMLGIEATPIFDQGKPVLSIATVNQDTKTMCDFRVSSKS